DTLLAHTSAFIFFKQKTAYEIRDKENLHGHLFLVFQACPPHHPVHSHLSLSISLSLSLSLSSPPLYPSPLLLFCVLWGSDGRFNWESRQFINPKGAAATGLTVRTWF